MEKSMHTPIGTAIRRPIYRVKPLQAFQWLRQGWRDMCRNPIPSLAHGALLTAMVWLILLSFGTHIELVAAAISGSLILGPLAASVFYQSSREMERGVTPAFDDALDGALARVTALLPLGIVLGAIAVLWAVVSRFVLESALGAHLPGPLQHTWETVLDWELIGFHMTYLGIGALFAAVAFAVSAVAAPLLFDRDLGTADAIAVGFRAIAANRRAMIVWAVVVAVLMILGFAFFMIGLVVILPLLGHATWHAYRALIG